MGRPRGGPRRPGPRPPAIGPAAGPDEHERPRDRADHIVQESVGLDLDPDEVAIRFTAMWVIVRTLLVRLGQCVSKLWKSCRPRRLGRPVIAAGVEPLVDVISCNGVWNGSAIGLLSIT